MINIVTALACEANPIIQHYRLRKSTQQGGFAVYGNERITLIISGMGKFAAASAVGYLQALLNANQELDMGHTDSHLWLNIGIAGHKTLDLGVAIMAHRVSDVAATQRYYPCFTFDLPCASAEVISVDQAETAYTTEAAYDMEALGFCAAASRFSSFELIHCLKIISDNQFTSHKHITKHVGEELIGHQLLIVESLLEEFDKIQTAMPDTRVFVHDYRLLTQRIRFSVAQKNQLRRLLQRWHVLREDSVIECLPAQDLNNANQVLAGIESHLQSVVYRC